MIYAFSLITDDCTSVFVSSIFLPAPEISWLSPGGDARHFPVIWDRCHYIVRLSDIDLLPKIFTTEYV